jgi:hypothetical protein
MVETPRLPGEEKVRHAGASRHPGVVGVEALETWIPAFAGMTKEEKVDFESTLRESLGFEPRVSQFFI